MKNAEPGWAPCLPVTRIGQWLSALARNDFDELEHVSPSEGTEWSDDDLTVVEAAAEIILAGFFTSAEDTRIEQLGRLVDERLSGSPNPVAGEIEAVTKHALSKSLAIGDLATKPRRLVMLRGLAISTLCFDIAKPDGDIDAAIAEAEKVAVRRDYRPALAGA